MFFPPLEYIIQIEISLQLLGHVMPYPLLALLSMSFLVSQKLAVDILHGIAVPVTPPLNLIHRPWTSHADVDSEIYPWPARLALQVPKFGDKTPNSLIVDADWFWMNQNADGRQPGASRCANLLGPEWRQIFGQLGCNGP